MAVVWEYEDDDEDDDDDVETYNYERYDQMIWNDDGTDRGEDGDDYKNISLVMMNMPVILHFPSVLRYEWYWLVPTRTSYHK